MAEPVWFLTSVYKYELIVPQINKNIVFIKILFSLLFLYLIQTQQQFELLKKTTLITISWRWCSAADKLSS